MKLEITDVETPKDRGILKSYLIATALSPSPLKFRLPIDNSVLAQLRLARQLSDRNGFDNTVVELVSTVPFQSLEAEICIPGSSKGSILNFPLRINKFEKDNISLTTFNEFSIHYSYKCDLECMLNLQLLLGENFKNAMFFIRDDKKLHTKICFPLCDMIRATGNVC